MATATTKPSGLTITRDGNKFAFAWKIPPCKFEEGQQLQYRIKDSNGWGKYIDISIGKTTTKKSISITVNNYYPPANKPHLGAIRFRVRGKRKNENNAEYTWSDWVMKEFDILAPNRPTLSAELSNSQSNVCTFSWETETSGTAKRWFRDVQWQTMIVKDCMATDGSALSWKTNATGYNSGSSNNATESQPVTEDTTRLSTGSWTRWFRIRARGPQGNSEWRYAKHVYASANQAETKKSEAEESPSGGIEVVKEWEAPSPATNPIDETVVQYAITVPAANLTCPASGVTWTDANISKDTKGTDSARFTIDDSLDDDECLFTRVNTVHDGNTTYGTADLTKIGNLKDPSNISVNTNATTFRATITATNNSAVPDAHLAILLRRSKQPGEDFVVGIIPHGSTSATVQCPDWTDDPVIAFGTYAFVGSYDRKTQANGTDGYAVTERMRSANIVWQGGAVPMAPDDVSAAALEQKGTVRVTWNWKWAEADSAELSWADHEDAWESTDAPQTYIISNMHASAWNVVGLETGKKWYFRIRLISGETYGSYSEMLTVDLSEPPEKPILELSQPTISEGEIFTAYWGYVSTDGTEQAFAEICEATVSSGTATYGDVIAHTLTAQHLDIEMPETWSTGNTYLLCVRVTSGSGKQSVWSDPVAITVAESLTAIITNTSLETMSVTTDKEQEITKTVLALTEMPLSVTVTGAGIGGITTLVIERAADYFADRPDETEFHGYEGETVVLEAQTSEGTFNISTGMLIGSLDDGAAYRIRAMVQDDLGQSDEATLDFEVHWGHQALVLEADALLRDTVILITPTAPTGTLTGDTCDIYRLSADRPVLIVEDAEFGQTYVDPYPAIGDAGGHRIVFKTANGDYITEDDTFAWIDIQDEFDAKYSIIDFDGEQILLMFGLTFSNNWEKDFKETRYLGGAVQGDWNRAVGRTSSMSAVSVSVRDDDTITAIRRLAAYPGICHVRTPDGSSFDADIQVSESRSFQTEGKRVDFAFNITRVDPQGLDGMTLDLWEES